MTELCSYIANCIISYSKLNYSCMYFIYGATHIATHARVYVYIAIVTYMFIAILLKSSYNYYSYITKPEANMLKFLPIFPCSSSLQKNLSIIPSYFIFIS